MDRPWSEYKGLKVVVTGAASGMGAATTSLLVAGGAEVYALDVQPIKQQGVKLAIECNLLDQSSIDAAIASIGEGVDAIFSCAGLPTRLGAVETMTVNFFAARYLIEQLLPKMNRGGAVAMISSLTLGWEQKATIINEALETTSLEESRTWIENNADSLEDAYPFSKYCIAAYVTFESPRFMKEFGVRLNALGPGITSSPMLASFKESSGARLDSLPNPIGRYSTPEEQAQVMMFLNSPLASYLSGANIPNDACLEAALKGGAMKAALSGAKQG